MNTNFLSKEKLQKMALMQIEELKADPDPDYEQTFYYQCQGCGSVFESDRENIRMLCATCNKPFEPINENGVKIE